MITFGGLQNKIELPKSSCKDPFDNFLGGHKTQGSSCKDPLFEGKFQTNNFSKYCFIFIRFIHLNAGTPS